jgi:hypothetical protein
VFFLGIFVSSQKWRSSKRATGFFLAKIFQMAIKNSLFNYLFQIGEDLVFLKKKNFVAKFRFKNK